MKSPHGLSLKNDFYESFGGKKRKLKIFFFLENSCTDFYKNTYYGFQCHNVIKKL